MHRTAFLTTLASVALATSLAHAQAPSAPTQQSEPPGARETPASPPTIQRVRVVDMEELPAATQAEVNQMVVERGDAELQKLRRSIEAAPAIKSALEAKGLSSAQVIVASLANDGELTLVTRKSG